MRVLILFLLTLVVAGCQCRPEQLQPSGDPRCGQACTPWTGSAPINPKGSCEAGAWICDTDGGMVCMGWVGPVQEVCDNQDNDCDGLVDEFLRRPCYSTCSEGWDICTAGAWECDAPLPVPEICNSKDDDCDGEVDEPTELPVEFCYTGPPGSAALGVCRPGAIRCYAGEKVCVGEQTPVPETCNNIDDDCDGAIDNGLAAVDAGIVDFVFVMDNSGSMSRSHTNVKVSTVNWGTKYGGRTDMELGVVMAPDKDALTYSWRPHLVQNLDTPAVFAQTMQTELATTGHIEEDTLGAIDRIVDPANPLGINWRPGARKVIVVFSDENPQYVGTPQKTDAQVVAALQGAHVVLHVFTDTTFIFNGKTPSQAWAPIVSAVNGTLWDISVPATTLESNLDTLIRTATCGTP
jgi:hypothetical protein